MTEQTLYITKEKKLALEKELALLPEQLIQAAKRVDEARQLGDLSENAEYHAAKDEVGRLHGRKKEIEYILHNAQIISHAKSDTVELGSTFAVEVNGKERTYTLVGAQEADPLEGRISNESPLGEALLGKKAGESVSIDTPSGNQEYTITSVE